MNLSRPSTTAASPRAAAPASPRTRWTVSPGVWVSGGGTGRDGVRAARRAAGPGARTCGRRGCRSGGLGLPGAGRAGACERRPRWDGRGCQREIWSASNHLLRELRLHLPSLFFPRRGFAIPQSRLLGFGLMAWLRLFGFFLNFILFFVSPFCSGAGETPSVRAQRARCRSERPGSRGQLCRIPARSGSKGSAAPLETRGAGGVRGNVNGGLGAFPLSKHPSVRPGSPPGCLGGRFLCREPWRDRTYLLLTRVLPEN